jgi:hypothetical protein
MSATLPADPQARLQELRARHTRFIYEGYEASRYGPLRDAQHLKFLFRLESRGSPDNEFAPETIIEDADWARWHRIPPSALDNFFFHLGLAEMFSYWKAACSPEIVIGQPVDEPFSNLGLEQISWWTDLLRRGMGEYFYVNQIDWRARDFVRIVATPPATPSHSGVILSGAKDLLLPSSQEQQVLRRSAPQDDRSEGDRDLVLTSGGKDSVVTLETLRAAGRPFDCLLLNPTQAALDVAKQAGCERPIIVHRTIDKRLLELNAAGYLNGHTPFSALLAFLGVTVAALFGHRRVIVSNERSAEEATVEYLGEPINHQYSKTFEFETKFRDYARKYLTPDIEYFSLLRPLYELQIAQRFAKYPQYFPLFRSCNRGQATNSWCGRCPKCLFVWTVLYPFVEREQMLGIFGGRDLLEWDGSAELLRDLMGLNAAKPFECVGTKEETLAALHLCAERYRAQGLPLPAGLASIAQTVLASRTDLPALAHRILTSESDHHYVPEGLARILTDGPRADGQS